MSWNAISNGRAALEWILKPDLYCKPLELVLVEWPRWAQLKKQSSSLSHGERKPISKSSWMPMDLPERLCSSMALTAILNPLRSMNDGWKPIKTPDARQVRER